MPTYKNDLNNDDIPDFMKPELKPELENENFTDVVEKTDDGTGNGLGTKVILFNDNYHTFEDVIGQVMKAIGCGEEIAFYHAHTVHTKGKSDVYKGDIQKCLNVSAILQEINLKTQIVG